MTIRLGTRRSALARAQADIVATALRRAWPEATVETLVFSTRGDARSGPLREVGGKGLFCTALEDALRDGRVDLAVHSAKDLPAKLDGDMVLAAVPVRGDPRDALVSPQGGAPEDLPAGARVGTGSPRRAAQLRAIRDDLAIVPLRGNVDTRVAKVVDGDEPLDAVVLAMAGLERLGLADRRAALIRPLQVERFVPAAGQGALAVEVHADHAPARRWAEAIDHADARAAVSAERALLQAIGADCHSCVGVHVHRSGAAWRARAMAADDAGRPVHVVAGADALGDLPAALAARLRGGAAGAAH